MTDTKYSGFIAPAETNAAMSGDVKRVARVLAGYAGRAFDDLHRDKAHWRETFGILDDVYRDVNDLRQDDLLEIATAAMRETRLIDAEALLAMSVEKLAWMDGDDMIDWLTTRAGEQPGTRNRLRRD